MDELRLAVRRLMKRPSATIASVVTLACATGAAAATWSLLSAVLISPVPVRDPDRVVVLGSRREFAGSSALYDAFLYPVFPAVRDSAIFDQVAGEWSTPEGLLVGSGGLPVQTRVGFASHEFFQLLGIAIPLGRSFSADDDRRGAPPVAILLDRYWRRAFDADPAAIGRTLTVRGKTVTIVGVAAKRFRGLDLAEAPELYLPLQTIGDVGYPTMNHFADPSFRDVSPTAGLAIIGRLSPNQTADQALQRLSSLALPAGTGRPRFGLTRVNTAAIPVAARDGMGRFTTLLAITVGLLLVIGCGTVGMLLLIRTEARRTEFATCLALGASRARLARGIGVEGALLSAGGALAGLPVAAWLFSGLTRFQLPGSVEIALLDLSLDRAALAASAAAAAGGTLLITLVAGAFGFSASVSDALRSRGGVTAPPGRRRTRAALVTAQVAVALVLLAGAGLFARSLASALALNSEVDMARVITGDVSLGPYGYDAPRAAVFFADLQTRLSRHPSVRSVAFSVSQGGMSPAGKIVVDGVPRKFPSTVWDWAVAPGYFRTMGIRLLGGREFTPDDRPGGPRVVIVSESYGRMLASGGDPIGHRITMTSSRLGKPADVMTIVGVAADVVTRVSVLEPLVEYLPIAQIEPGTRQTLNVRIAAGADAARRDIVSTIKQADPAVLPSPLSTLDEDISRQMGAQKFGATVLGALGAIAVLLTVLGAYVLSESMAVLRMREMGIRAALGATGRQLGAIVLAETARLVGLGLAAGLGLAWLGASTIRTFLFQVQPLDPTTLTAVAALILTLALAVSLRPALRAARVDLGRILKDE